MSDDDSAIAATLWAFEHLHFSHYAIRGFFPILRRRTGNNTSIEKRFHRPLYVVVSLFDKLGNFEARHRGDGVARSLRLPQQP
jgi:hypothetical protein